MTWDAVSAGEIAQRTRLDSKLVSAQLRQILQNEIVEMAPTDTKNHLYRLCDRFFNIWYLMRMGRKNDKNKVLWLVRFLEGWCNKDQLRKRTEKHLSALNREGYNPKAAYILSTALNYVEEQDLTDRYGSAKIIQAAKEACKSIPDSYAQHTLSCIYLWNGEIALANETARHFLYDRAYMEDNEQLQDQEFLHYFYLMMAKEQYDYLYQYFSSDFAQQLHLKDRIKPVWYALLHYLRHQYPSAYLRMPPELKQTVAEIMAKVEQMRIDYTAGDEV